MVLALLQLLAPAAEARPVFGGYGHFSNGFVFGDIGGLHDAVHDAIGGAAPSIAQTWGGGGRMLLLKYLVIGGGGYAIFDAHGRTASGSVELEGGGGGVNLGGVVWSDDRGMVYLYGGAQGLGFDVTVRDNTDTGTQLGDVAIASGREATVQAGTWLLDIGAGSQEFLFRPEAHGGWTLGGEAGVLVGLSGDPWESLGGGNAGLGDARATMGYVRLDIGGGGFLTDKHRQ